jgi:hypothetical protein
MDAFWNEFLNSTPYKGKVGKKKDHTTQDLAPILRDFKLLGACVADLNGDDMKAMQQRITENPSDLEAQQELLARTNAMTEKYMAAIDLHLNEPGRTALWAKVCQLGNNSFKKVYTTIWNETIFNAESGALTEYSELVGKMRPLLENPSITRQPQSSLLELYVKAATIKPIFDAVIQTIAEEFKMLMERSLDVKGTMNVQSCAALKNTSRMTEKSQLKGVPPGNMAGVKDIVRVMLVGNNMTDVNHIIQIITGMHIDGQLEIVNVKDRFMTNISPGGWRDLMLNVVLADATGNKHICEIQISHKTMLNARTEMNGHAIYNRVRNSLEMMTKSRGSTDAALLAEFEMDLDKPKFHNWLSEMHVSTWEGVVECSPKQEVWEIDLAILDPQLQVRFLLPNLRRISFSSVYRIAKLTPKYIRQFAEDYKFHALAVDFGNQKMDINDGILEMLAQIGVRWVELNLKNCPLVTDKGLAFLAQLPKLSTLNLLECGEVSDGGLAHLVANSPSLNAGCFFH